MTEAALSLTERFRLSRFFQGEAPSLGPITLNQRRIFILPSQYGLVFVGLLVLILLIAFVYNNNLAYMLGFLLASIFFVTILHCFKSLDGLVVRSGFSQSVFAGTSVAFVFQIQNPTNQFRFAIDVQLKESLLIDLSPSQTQILTFYMPAICRGWQDSGTLTLSSRYPLGLFRAWSPLRLENKVLIYPKPAADLLPFPETDTGYEQNVQHQRDGDEFYGLKAYTSSDSIRRIHWKSLAKGRGLKAKEYVGANCSQLWLDYAATPGLGVEERLSQLCRWLIEAEQAGLFYGLILPGVRIEPDTGKLHHQKCLEALALF